MPGLERQRNANHSQAPGVQAKVSSFRLIARVTQVINVNDLYYLVVVGSYLKAFDFKNYTQTYIIPEPVVKGGKITRVALVKIARPGQGAQNGG
jgi:hypothetical protein